MSGDKSFDFLSESVYIAYKKVGVYVYRSWLNIYNNDIATKY